MQKNKLRILLKTSEILNLTYVSSIQYLVTVFFINSVKCINVSCDKFSNV